MHSKLKNMLLHAGRSERGGERGDGPGHPSQGGIQRVKLQKLKCCVTRWFFYCKFANTRSVAYAENFHGGFLSVA